MKMDLELVVNHYGPDGLVGDRLPLLDYGVIFCHKHPDGSFHYGASDTLQNAQSEKVIKFVSDYLDSNGKSSLVELKCRSYDQINLGVLSFTKPFPKQVGRQLKEIIGSHNASLQQKVQVTV